MIGLVRAELLKIRRRQATYVLLIIDLVLMILTVLAYAWGLSNVDGSILQFPDAYGVIGQFAFGLGGLLGVVFAAAFVGADWNWGVVRNVVARGESRINYLLAKAIALAISFAIACLIVFALGIVMVYVSGLIFGVPVASPLRGRGLQDLADNLILGFPVLLQRTALGLMVAVLLRSQVAGAVIGIALYVGEAILTTVLLGITLIQDASSQGTGVRGLGPIGPEWYQFLPISIGGNVLDALPGGSGAAGVAGGGGIQQIFLKPVPLEQALLGVGIYLVVALALALFAINRQEIA